MTTRIIAGRSYSVKTHTICRDDISADTRYQTRLSDSPFVRAGSITHAVKTSGSPKFYTNPVLINIDDVYYVVEGFGRIAAASAGFLDWPTLDVDVLCGKNVEKQAIRLSLTANNKHADVKAFSKKELEVNAFKLSQLGDTPAEIADSQGCCLETAKKRVLRGRLIEKRLMDVTPDPSASVEFGHYKNAYPVVTRALNDALRLQCRTLEETVEVMLTKFGIQLRVWTGSNEKLVVGLPYYLLQAAEDRQPTNFLVLLFVSKIDETTAAARRAFENVVRYAPRCVKGARVHCEDLSNEACALNSTAIRQFVKECKADLQ